MKYQQRNNRNHYEQGDFHRLHAEDTDPMLHRITVGSQWSASAKPSFGQKVAHFFTVLVKKINQLLGLGLLLLLLLFLVRLFLVGIGSTRSLFSGWIFFLSAPLIRPFTNLLPDVTYSGYLFESATLCAMVAYLLGIMLVRLFFKLLVAKPR